MTKRESLERTIAMWDEMAEENYADKDQYFVAHPEIKRPRYMCFACEYTGRQTGRGGSFCKLCPVWRDGERCHSDWRTYVGWFSATEEERPIYAKAVADLARARLQELEENDD